jgi:hypothetical protein
MTAVACSYAEIDGLGGPLSETLVSELDEQDLTRLLVRRFRLFLALGHGPGEALLCAVGYAEDDATELALTLCEPPALLH